MSVFNSIRKKLELSKVKIGAFEFLWLIAPIFLWFSYQPLFKLGQDSTMYFELSLALVYMLILAFVGLPMIWRNKNKLSRNKGAILAGLLLLFTTVSLFWTPNLVRGVLTVGVLGIIYLIYLAVIAEKERIRNISPALIKITLLSSIVISTLAIAQMFLGIGLGQGVTLLCDGCVAGQFGFVRPNVFTIEPQFLGSMLLLPIMLGAWLYHKGNRGALLKLAILLSSAAIFLTLSRGAIYALIIGLLIFAVLSIRRLTKVIVPLGIVVGGFLIGLFLQGLTAAINPNINESFVGAVTKTVNHMSLGKINLNPTEEPGSQPAPTMTQQSVVQVDPNYDGYVEESTNIRLQRSEIALNTWKDGGTSSVVFGVGVGGAGYSMNSHYPEDIGAREIVQNEYIERLLEGGLIGLSLLAFLMIAILSGLFRHRSWWAFGLVVAFMVQWTFFSGYPNALHVYLFMALAGAGIFSAHHAASKSAKRY